MDYWIIAQLSTPPLASEGSGDSETDMEFVDDHGLPCMQERAADDDDDDDDDAESCSYESYGRAQIEYGSDDGGESDGDDDGDHEKGVCAWLQANASEKKEDKEVKVVDSEDDNRRFWETCLATGY